jgi:hypothetical protein
VIGDSGENRALAFCALLAFVGGGARAFLSRNEKTTWKDVTGVRGRQRVHGLSGWLSLHVCVGPRTDLSDAAMRWDQRMDRRGAHGLGELCGAEDRERQVHAAKSSDELINMNVFGGQLVGFEFPTVNGSRVPTDADSLPTGTLVVNGNDNGATVTVTHKTTGTYKAAVTLPTLVAGDIVQVRIAATVGGSGSGGIAFTATSDALRSGKAQAGGTSSITLDAGASPNGFVRYLASAIAIVAGTGVGQTRSIINYIGFTKIATVDFDWEVVPDATSVFAILPAKAPRTDEGGTTNANLVLISSQSPGIYVDQDNDTAYFVVVNDNAGTTIPAKITADHGSGSYALGGLSGPSSATLTWLDASDASVPNVDFTIAGQGAGRANASGIATFGLPDGTYQVITRITNGVVFANASLVVSGTTALTIHGATQAIATPSAPGLAVAYVALMDPTDPVVGATISYRMTKAPDGDALGFDFSTKTSGASDSTGLIQFEVPKGSEFAVWWGTGPKIKLVVPADSDSVEIAGLEKR